ncbi:hypothetical protein LOK49_LG04G01510 [Camellia lanceoleosa]|uniref:Uncharacterized protein n=1 Tax=Camellia lanceoleosa TaxID=1840588 RepID=A0ACC0I223_9ERIC|nr:hypothetical protein LOK49_LG04G01510 [Camellia lanceoleosa]
MISSVKLIAPETRKRCKIKLKNTVPLDMQIPSFLWILAFSRRCTGTGPMLEASG